MEAKREVTLPHPEMPFPQIMKEVGTSLSTKSNVGYVKRIPGFGRKPSAVTPRLVSVFNSQIDRNPISSMRRVVKNLNVSEATIRKVVKMISLISPKV